MWTGDNVNRPLMISSEPNHLTGQGCVRRNSTAPRSSPAGRSNDQPRLLLAAVPSLPGSSAALSSESVRRLQQLSGCLEQDKRFLVVEIWFIGHKLVWWRSSGLGAQAKTPPVGLTR